MCSEVRCSKCFRPMQLCNYDINLSNPNLFVMDFQPENDINGAVLIDLDEDLLEEMGIAPETSAVGAGIAFP